MNTTGIAAKRILVPRIISAGSYHALLALLVTMYALGPFLRGPAGSVFTTLVWIAILISAVGAVAVTRKMLITGMVVMAVATIVGEVADRALETGTTIRDMLRSLAILFVTVVITVSVFSQRRVTARTISGSICIFLLMGLLWSTLYVLVEKVAPGSFRGLPDVAGLDPATRHEALTAALHYYSHVTLTTLGYGDVVPVSPVARTLSTLEAIGGQIFLVVAVARLVGLHIAGVSPRRETGAE